jgi:hypothetical protein
MIRKTTTLLTVGFLTLSGLTAMAAPVRHARQAKASLAVATEGAAPAGDTKADAKTEKADKKTAKSTKGHATKEKAAEGTPTPTPAPAAGEKMPDKK